MPRAMCDVLHATCFGLHLSVALCYNAQMEDDQGSGEAPRGPTAGPAMSVDAVARDVLATR